MDGPADGRPRTLFFGSGGFAVPVVQTLAGSRIVELIGVVTAPPRPSGRDRTLRPTPVAEAASAIGLPILTPGRLRDEASLVELADVAPDLVILADYGRLVPAAVLDLPRHGALNLHPSLLPRHRGASPTPAAILAGDPETGVSLMRMDEGLDTGPIIATRRVSLTGAEDAPELETRLADVATALLIDTLPDWLAGRAVADPQPDVGATLTRPLTREDGRLDADRGATTLERQVRAYRPWPGSFLDDGPTRLGVRRASVVEPVDPGARPGTLAPYLDSLALVAGEGWLRLDEVQPAGRGPMTGAAYRRGRR